MLDVLSTIVSMTVVDHFMESVSGTFRSMIVETIVILSVKEIGKSKKNCKTLLTVLFYKQILKNS